MSKHRVVVLIVKIAQSALNCDCDCKVIIRKGFLLKALNNCAIIVFFHVQYIDFVRYQTFLYLFNNFEFAFAWYSNVLKIQDSWELSSDWSECYPVTVIFEFSIAKIVIECYPMTVIRWFWNSSKLWPTASTNLSSSGFFFMLRRKLLSSWKAQHPAFDQHRPPDNLLPQISRNNVNNKMCSGHKYFELCTEVSSGVARRKATQMKISCQVSP